MTQPRRRRNPVMIVLIVLISVAVLCCGGGGVGVYSFYSSTVKHPSAATEAFLDELESGDLTAAYDRLCATTKARFEPAAFAEAVNRRKPVSHDVHWGGSYQARNGIETATISADMSYEDGGRDVHAFPLRNEDGGWKLCGNPF